MFIIQDFRNLQNVNGPNMTNFYQNKNQLLTAFFPQTKAVCHGVEITQTGDTDEFAFSSGVLRFEDQEVGLSDQIQAIFSDIEATPAFNISLSVGSGQHYICAKVDITEIDAYSASTECQILPIAYTLAEIAGDLTHLPLVAVTETGGNWSWFRDANCAYNYNTHNAIPVGSILAWTADAAPANYLVCDGSILSKTDYSELWSFARLSGNLAVDDATWLADNFGQFCDYDADNFRVPLLEDTFLQGASLSRLIGTWQDSANKAHTHDVTPTGGDHLHTATTTGGDHTHTLSGSGAISGGAHTHPITDPGHVHSVNYQNDNEGTDSAPSWSGNGAPQSANTQSAMTGITVGSSGNTNTWTTPLTLDPSGITVSNSGNLTISTTVALSGDLTFDTVTTTSQGEIDARPKNVAYPFIIKYK